MREVRRSFFPGFGCVPDAPCSSITAVFRAERVGRSAIVARRDTCNSFVPCGTASLHFRLDLVVAR